MRASSDLDSEDSELVDLSASLKVCEKVAKEEFEVAETAVAESAAAVVRLIERIETIAVPDAEGGREASEQLEELREGLSSQVEELQIVAREKLARKKRRLKKFTIALFGRTQAGKSTLREAITGGTGKSIGKGGQNFTRRVREYSWHGLRIVDTPGFASPSGSKLAKRGRQIVEESDVVLFLVNMDFQKEHFNEVQHLIAENKPVVVILNVRKALADKNLKPTVHFQRALRDESVVFKEEDLKAIEGRIRKVVQEQLGMKKVTIIRVHAQAALLSGLPAHAKDSEALFAFSRLNELFRLLLVDVKTHGPVRRLQTLLDGTIGTLESMANGLAQQVASIRETARFYRRKTKELRGRLDRFSSETKKRLEHESREMYLPLRRQVAGFVEDNIEKKDVEDLWKARVRGLNLEKRSKELQESVIADLKTILEEFKKDLKFDARLISDMNVSGPARYTGVDYRKGLEWVATAAGGLGPAALLVGTFVGEIAAANFWNPVGQALIVVGVIAIVVSFIFKKKGKRLARAKAKAVAELQKGILKAERETTRKLKSWFKKEVTIKGMTPVLGTMDSLCQQLEKLARALKATEQKNREQIKSLDRRLLLRTAELLGRGMPEEKVAKVARARGKMSKVLLDSAFRGHKKTLSEIEQAIREPIVGVVNTGKTEKLALRALEPGKIEAGAVRFTGKQILLDHPPKMPRNLKNLQDINRQLAAEIVGMQMHSSNKS